MKKINLKKAEIKAITWIEDVDGIAAYKMTDGTISIRYEDDPNCMFMDEIARLTAKEVAEIVLGTTDKLN